MGAIDQNDLDHRDYAPSHERPGHAQELANEMLTSCPEEIKGPVEFISTPAVKGYQTGRKCLVKLKNRIYQNH